MLINNKNYNLHTVDERRRGAVDITFESGIRRPGFESRKGIRFLGKHSSANLFNYLI
jgi:hypothetical protein